MRSYGVRVLGTLLLLGACVFMYWLYRGGSF